MKKQDNVLQEFPAISKYRVRLLKDTKGNEVLDIREYIQNEQFQGYTRRGIRLTYPEQTGELHTIIHLLTPPEQLPPVKPKKGGKK